MGLQVVRIAHAVCLFGFSLSTSELLAQTTLPDWNLTFLQPAVARNAMSMVYDTSRRAPVLFGGRNNAFSTVFSDTYAYTPTGWTQLSTLHSPPGRYWAGSAYDQNRQRMVVFGGLNTSGPNPIAFGDTWEFDGTDWASIATAHTPGAQAELAMTYDSCRQKVLAFGAESQTWEYDGVDWAQVSTSVAPPGRFLSSIVFDPARCRAILFGGLPTTSSGPLNALQDTWEYDGSGTWVQIKTPTTPPGRWAHGMAFDINRSKVVVFGGYGPTYPTGSDTNDTWEYDGTTWAQTTPPQSPGASEQVGMVYDRRRARTVMFGGWLSPNDQAWEYVGADPSCTYSLAPSSANVRDFGGFGFFSVNTGNSCEWIPVPSASWISIAQSGSRGPGGVGYTIQGNSGPARSGSIAVGGQTFSISQAGLVCYDSLNPTAARVPGSGGNVTVWVRSQPACSWTAVSNVSWVVVQSGATGQGRSAVVLNVLPNPSGFRSGTVTIAGNTFTVNQQAGRSGGGNACGAVNETSVLTLVQGQIAAEPPGPNLYYQDISITNHTGTTINGPIYLVLIGLPNSSGAGLTTGYTPTYCFSSFESSLVLISSGGIAPGGRIVTSLYFVTPLPPFPSLNYTPVLLSGAPSR
jgi:hypothetical protein